MTATALVREALRGSGVDLVASCGVRAWDERAPHVLQTAALMRDARGVVVAASAGPALWRELGARAPWQREHPLDTLVAEVLARADQALARAGVRFRRFEASFHAQPRLDFVALGEIAGLGSRGPFGMLIHEQHGPWWALRGAWLVDADVEPPPAHRPPCAGCAAPCVSGWDRARGVVAQATFEVRSRCVLSASRYDDDQIAYHSDRAATIARLRDA